MHQFAKLTLVLSTTVLALLCGNALYAQEQDSQEKNTQQIPNLRAYSPTFASSGQPSTEQLQQLQRDGFERIIYIAFSDHKQSVMQEDRVVKSLGMDYLQIPVVWASPSASDFALFASAMQQAPTKKTLLHCQMNYRASAFALLYRVIYLEVPLAQAMTDMQSVWTPTEHWVVFMQQILQAHGKTTRCAGCEWIPATQE